MLIAQISTGMWVRNGMSIRAQAINYKEAVLATCYDHDIFMVQICANMISGESFLATLISRFDLCSLYSDQIESTEGLVIADMAEHMIKFITTILSERSYACGISVQEEVER